MRFVLKKISLALAVCLLAIAMASPLHGQSPAAVQGKVCTAARTAVAPRVDGRLDDDSWQWASPAGDFVQNLPIEGAPASQHTEVRILYDNSAIYVAARMYDPHPDSILTELGSRDDGGLNSDWFRISIDPYNKRQDAFSFQVYASGVQVDYKESDGTFDAVWQSAVRIDSLGWTAELKIPYSAIRFPNNAEQHWAMELTRTVRRTREVTQWSLTPNIQANALKFWGQLEGLQHIASPIRLSVTPYVSLGMARAPEFNPDNTFAYSNSKSIGGGLDIKYGIDERFTLDMTLFPDFSQVQSDKKVKNLSYREIVYSENRPFFREGTELFNKGGLFYSRRIAGVPAHYYDVPDNVQANEVIQDNPSQAVLLNATKVSGRTNHGLGIGVLNAVTGDTYAHFRADDGSDRRMLTNPFTNFNIIVLDQQMKNNSDVYLINTDVLKNNGYRDANVTGAGISLFDKSNRYGLSSNAALSQVMSKPNDVDHLNIDKAGYKYDIQAGKVSGNFTYFLQQQVANTTFDSRDLGYLIINNYINEKIHLEYDQYTPRGFLRNQFDNIEVLYGNNYRTLDRSACNISYNVYGTFMSYHSAYIGGGVTPVGSRDYNEPRTAGWYYCTPSSHYEYVGISSDYRRRLAVDFSFTYSTYLPGNANNFKQLPYFSPNGTLRYRFSNRFSLSHNFVYSVDPYNTGYVANDGNRVILGSRLLTTYTNNLSGKYIFSSNMFLSLNIRHYWNTGLYRQYYSLQTDGLLQKVSDYNTLNDFSYNVFNVDLVFSWMFAPGSTLSIAYKNAIEKQDANLTPGYGDDFYNTLSDPQLNSLTVKMLYYLDYLYLRKPEKNRAQAL